MTNIKLTYEYCLNSINQLSGELDKINTKLAVLLTFSGVLVNFGKDLPSSSVFINCTSTYYPCPACYLLKFVAYSFFIIAIAIGLRGLAATSSTRNGKIILPEQLLSDDWNRAEEEIYLISLIQYLEKETLLELEKMRNKKENIFSLASFSLGIAVMLLCLDEILSISIPVLGNLCLNLPH
ncbi:MULTISPECIES: hypothetical protein [Spirulina sp. CCY15215]|uniref:hypothetical protein n=1 Tax=Spirulina sp. CCY15215 TaxID=2767591 RepID=UPI00194FA63D|nr:hypothetical protein [Spirulina major]